MELLVPIASCIETPHDLFKFALKDDALAIDAARPVRLPTGESLGAELDRDWIDDHTVQLLSSSDA